jgi:hypothetical protein
MRASGGLPHAFKERARMRGAPPRPAPFPAEKMACWRPDAEPKHAEPKGLGLKDESSRLLRSALPRCVMLQSEAIE